MKFERGDLVKRAPPTPIWDKRVYLFEGGIGLVVDAVFDYAKVHWLSSGKKGTYNERELARLARGGRE